MKFSKSLSAIAIVALAGTSAGAQVINWAAPVDGNWNDAFNWGPANVPNTIGEDAILGLVGAYTVDATDNFSIGGLSITNPAATLTIESGRTLTVNSNNLLNNGLVVVNATSSVFNAHLSFASDSMISGSGSIMLNATSDLGDAQILANSFTITHANGHLIHGSGNISGAIANSGDIIADFPLGAGLRLNGTNTQTASGRIGADEGTLFLGGNSVTTGGELFSINGGIVQVDGTLTSIGDITNTGHIGIPGGGQSLLLDGDLQNDGTLSINFNSLIFNSHLRINTDAIINGTGTIEMGLGSFDLNDAQFFTEGAFTGTIGAGQTVIGAGRINGANGGNIINLGTFIADVPDTELQLLGLISGDADYLSNGGIIGLGGGLVLDGGTFDSTGAGISKLVAGGVATLSNITNNGQMGVNGNGGTVSLVGPMTNNGAFNINDSGTIFNAHLRFDATTAITGNGTIHMQLGDTDLNDAQLFTNGAFVGTIGANQTVEGAGRINGANDGIIVNNGVINANHVADGKTPAKRLQLLGNHDGSGGGLYQSDDAILDLGNDLILDGGTFDTTGVGIVNKVDSGIATLSNITNLGQMGIVGNGGSISLLGPMVNDGAIEINSNANIFNAHLRFAATTAITGNGTIHMQLGSTDHNDAQVFTDGAFIGTIGANQTVEGAGRINGANGGTIINLGTFNGNDPINELQLLGNHTGGGVYRSDDGILALRNGLILTGGTLDSSGTGIVDMTNSGLAMLSGVTNNGTMGIRGQGGIVGLTGPLTNNGTILINSNENIFNAHIRFLDATIIDGTGIIDLHVSTAFDDAQILNDSGFIGTIGSGQTITGSGRLQGEMNMDGTIDPGSNERKIQIDTLHLAPSSELIVDLGGTLAGEFDQIELGNADTINIDGTITMNLDPAYFPSFGDTWDVISGGTINGEFTVEDMPEAPAIGQVYRVIYENDRVYIILTCDVDFSGDGSLNFFDVSAFLTLFNSQDVRGDLNQDGSFNFFDISIFLTFFSQACN